jgi:MscS family membrane protein
VWTLSAAVAFRTILAIGEGLVSSPKINPRGIQASYIRAMSGVIGFVFASIIVIYGLSKLGVALAPLLTGVGIGGLAIALAARPTLTNLIGSFTIFADKPYRIGQRIKVMGQDGTVESIGLRSTKIRLLTGPLTAIPNEKMASLEIENIGRRPYIRRTFNIKLSYDTPPEKINRAIDILRKILAVPDTGNSNNTKTTPAKGGTKSQLHPNEAINKKLFPPRVFFNEINPDTLNIQINYWYHPPDWWDYMEHAHNINIQIMDRLNAEGIHFALPTQAVHLAANKNNQTMDSQDEEVV